MAVPCDSRLVPRGLIFGHRKDGTRTPWRGVEKNAAANEILQSLGPVLQRCDWARAERIVKLCSGITWAVAERGGGGRWKLCQEMRRQAG